MIGLIAQEVLIFIPKAIHVSEDEERELRSMDYEKLIPVLINAIKEQQSMIGELEAKLVENEQENIHVKKRLKYIEDLITEMKSPIF